jgi:glycosyltransferase involved in cell wall biosynthesis
MNKTSPNPPISAVIPVRNGERFIQTSFLDVQRNLALEDEAIFVVNGTSDSTLKILEKLSESDNRVRIIEVEEGGIVGALNLGIQESKHSWIARFDVDDFYSTDRLSQQRKLISKDTVAIFSDYNIVGLNDEDLGIIPTGVNHLPTAISLFGKNRTPHPVAMFSKAAFLESGKYRQGDFPAEDLGLWLRMTRVGEFRTVPLPLLRYTLHGNSISLNHQNVARKKAEELVSKIGIEQTIIQQAIDSTKFILQEYEVMSYAGERKLLFLTNLYHAISHLKCSPRKKRSLKNSIISKGVHPSFIFPTLRLGTRYKARRNYRSQILTRTGQEKNE